MMKRTILYSVLAIAVLGFVSVKIGMDWMARRFEESALEGDPSESDEEEGSRITPQSVALNYLRSLSEIEYVHSDITVENSITPDATVIYIVEGTATAKGESTRWRVITSDTYEYIFAHRFAEETFVKPIEDEYLAKNLGELVEVGFD